MPTKTSHNVTWEIVRAWIKGIGFYSQFEVLLFAEMEKSIDTRYGKRNVVNRKPGGIGKEMNSLA
jgi:hypothetical protein